VPCREPVADYFIMAGDIMLFSEMYRYDDSLIFVKDLQSRLLDTRKSRILSFKYGWPGWRIQEKIRDNVFLLNDTVEIIENVRFVF